MEERLWAIICILFVCIAILGIKLYLMRKSAREIKEGIANRLMTDSNTLIDLSSRDCSMRSLAECLNEELRKLRKERRRFVQGDLELKETITNVSHDLRTPLTAICGYLDLLEKEEKSEAVSHYLTIIAERTESLKQLTEELFRYSMVASSIEELQLEDVVLNYALEESVSAYYAAFIGCHIEPEIVMPDVNVTRRLDKNAVHRIFSNIFSNAIKYSDGDLQITLFENGEILFSNSAFGLDEIKTRQLFERYYTVETARKSTGIGLSIAKTLTERMHGSITAHYVKGRLELRVFFAE